MFDQRAGSEFASSGAMGVAVERGETPRRAAPPRGSRIDYQRIKTALHREVIEAMDVSKAGRLAPEEQRRQLRALARHLAERRGQSPSIKGTVPYEAGIERLVDEVLDEIFGLGPLEALMHDAEVTDILVNGPSSVYVERRGRLEETDVVFADDAHLMQIIQRVVGRVGRRIDESSPMVDARLPDGSRLNAVIPPLALKGPTLSIRRFQKERITLPEMVRTGSLRPEMADFLAAAVRGRLNILICGGTGAGKTTLLNNLSGFIPRSERVVTIEQTAELTLQQPHVVALEVRPPNIEGTGEVTQRELLRNSLRMRPDRIIVGDVLGPEVLDMLQAMNTGHDGSLSTVHANDTRDALSRLELMTALSGVELPTLVVRQYIAGALDLVVHVARLAGGVRRVMRVSEVVGYRRDGGATDGDYEIEDLFVFRQTGLDEGGSAEGEFYATGYEPRALPRMAALGVVLPREMFEARELGGELRVEG